MELTGDNEYYNTRNIQDADIILTTPEVVGQIKLLHCDYVEKRIHIYASISSMSLPLFSYGLNLSLLQKFDAVTRYRIKDGGLSFFSDIALVLIDEVHLLNDPRGAALEAIVSRIKMLSRNSEMKSSPLALVRFLAVSATIPNVDDLGENF